MTNEEKIDYLQGEVLFFDLLSRILLAQPKTELLETLVAGDVFSEVPFAGSQAQTALGIALLQQFTEGSKAQDADGSEDAVVSAKEQAYDLVNSDYINVLVGLGAPLAPPWETSYLGKQDKLLFQAETLEVRARYKQFGLELQNKYHEPDDTITYELEFVCHLAQRALAALVRADEGAGTDVVEPADGTTGTATDHAAADTADTPADHAAAGVADTADRTAANYKTFLEAQRDFSQKHLLQWVYDFCEALYTNAKSDYYKGLSKLLAGGMEELSISWDALLSDRF